MLYGNLGLGMVKLSTAVGVDLGALGTTNLTHRFAAKTATPAQLRIDITSKVQPNAQLEVRVTKTSTGDIVPLTACYGLNGIFRALCLNTSTQII